MTNNGKLLGLIEIIENYCNYWVEIL